MIKRTVQIAIILVSLSLACVTGVHAQTPEMQQMNKTYLDSAEAVIRDVFCKGQVQYASHYSKRFIRRALAMVQVMNDISTDDFRLENLDRILHKLRTHARKEIETPQGEVKALVIHASTDNFPVKIRLKVIDGLIVGKDYYIDQKARCNCGGVPQSMQDFPLMKRLLAEHAVFPVKIMDRNDHLYFRKLVYPNLTLLANSRREYRFVYDLKDEDKWTNRLLEEQYIYDRLIYNPERPDEGFAKLISKGKDRLIMHLLYSPNYFYAVNAMESLIYLESIGRVTIDDSLKARIKAIKEANYPILSAVTDVIYTREGYKNAYMNDSRVIEKYARSLRR